MPRGGHSAILLPNGSVLVHGGDPYSGRTTEIYDPHTEGWSGTGSSSDANWGPHFLLETGNVVSFGINHVEQYYPTEGEWRVIRAKPPGANVLLRLLNGRFLFTPPTRFDTFQIYDLNSDTWVATSLPTRQITGIPTLLKDGRVLFVGGPIEGPNFRYSNAADLYDPISDAWSPTGDLLQGRVGHTATLLQDGRVLVAGGGTVIGDHFGPSLDTVELYDPLTGNWSVVGKLHVGRQDHRAIMLPDGKVLVAGGITAGALDLSVSTELFDPKTLVWTVGADLNVPRTGHSMTLLQSHLSPLPNQTFNVLVAGATNETETQNDKVELCTFSSDSGPGPSAAAERPRPPGH